MTVDSQTLANAQSTDADVRQRVAQQLARTMSDSELTLLFEMLGDKDWRVRKTIVEGVLRRPDERVIRHLLLALHDGENAGKRNSATEALIRIGAPALPHILAAIDRDRDLDVRLSLVNLLGDLQSSEALDTLLRLLPEESDINMISSIVSSIGKYRDARAIPALLRTLGKEDLWLKFHVIEALGEIGDRTALPAILPYYSEKSLRKPVLEALGRIGDIGTVSFLLKIVSTEEKLNLTALRALAAIAEAEKPRVVEAAERTLIRRKFRETFPHEKIKPLIEHLRTTPKREVKNFILKFLGWSGNPDALPVLLDSLELPDSAEVAAQSLAEFGSEATLAVIERLGRVDDDEVVALLLRVLNVVAGKEAIPAVLSFLDHDNASIRRLAIETLSQLVDPGTIDYLLAKLDDWDVACQQAAVNSISALVEACPEIKGDTLAKIRKYLSAPSIPVKLNSLSVYVNIQGEGYHDELLLASKDGDPVIRQKAVSLMGKFGENRFADQLVLSLADESNSVRLAAIEALVKLRSDKGLEPLVAALEDRDTWIRTAAAQALGAYRDPAVVAPLIERLYADVPPVRIAAIEALGRSESADVRATLFDCLEDDDVEIQRAAILALAKIPGREVLEELLSQLGSGDWRLRAAAAASLGLRGDPVGLEPLHEALANDPDPYVRQSVVMALEKLGSRSSFPWLLAALDNRAILDDVSELFVRHIEIYRDLLENAWRTADSRRERVIAAILQSTHDATLRKDGRG
jgi:HEAT repeat protein